MEYRGQHTLFRSQLVWIQRSYSNGRSRIFIFDVIAFTSTGIWDQNRKYFSGNHTRFPTDYKCHQQPPQGSVLKTKNTWDRIGWDIRSHSVPQTCRLSRRFDSARNYSSCGINAHHHVTMKPCQDVTVCQQLSRTYIYRFRSGTGTQCLTTVDQMTDPIILRNWFWSLWICWRFPT